MDSAHRLDPTYPASVICQNPRCQAQFITVHEHDYFCDDCRKSLTSLQKRNILYFMMNGEPIPTSRIEWGA